MAPPNAALRRVFRTPVYLYRWKCGWLLGHRFLLLIHVGRRTGLCRHTVLEVMEYRREGPEAVVMSAFGRTADWLRNIEAIPNPRVVIGSHRERNGLAEASASIDVSASADRVWRLIGGFGSLPDWLPYISKSELSAGGRVRHLANLGGDTIVERLEAFDDAARSYSYSILEAPFPVSGYLSTLRVQQAAEGNRSRVEWSGKFTPEGVSAAEASRLFRRIFEDGLRALTIKFS